MSGDLVARRLAVRGLVQGVNFRAWVRDRALSRGVTGWASNCADGSVEVWLQGPRDAVAEVERSVGEGPRHACVERIDGDDVTPRDDLRAFERR